MYCLALVPALLYGDFLWSQQPACAAEAGDLVGKGPSKQELPALLDMETAVNVALKNHPALQAQSYRTRAAWDRPQQAAALADPMIMAGVDKLYLDGEGVDYMFQVTQSFPLSRIRARRAELEQARARGEDSTLESLRLDSELATRLAFIDVWEWDRVIETTEASLTLAKAAADLSLTRYGAGETSQVDVLRATAERAGQEASCAVVRENRASRVAALLASMGISPGREDASPLRLQAPPEPEAAPDLAPLLREAEENRPELHRAQAAVDEAVASKRVARSQYLPQAQVLSGYMLSTMESDSYQGMLGVSVPLWVGWRNKAVSEAEARAEANRLETASLLLEIQKEVVELHIGLRAALVSRDALREEVLPRSEAAAEAAFAAYEAGAAGLVSLIDAQRALYEARLEAARAQADACRRHARLMRAVGRTSGTRNPAETGEEDSASVSVIGERLEQARNLP